MQTAARLLSTRSVPSLQLELTRTRASREQTCAALNMLKHLAVLGYEFRQVPNQIVDADLPAPDTWRDVAGPWDGLPAFPTAATAEGARRNGFHSPMEAAYAIDFQTHSTNLVARRPASHSPPQLPWPSLGC